MIPHPSKKFFRQLLIFGLLVKLISYFITYYGFDITSDEEAMLISLNYLGSRLHPATSWHIDNALLVADFVGIIAMIFFQGWGRWILLGTLLTGFLLTNFMGMIINTGASHMLWIVESTFISIPWVLSFFHPCSGYFQKQKR